MVANKPHPPRESLPPLQRWVYVSAREATSAFLYVGAGDLNSGYRACTAQARASLLALPTPCFFVCLRMEPGLHTCGEAGTMALRPHPRLFAALETALLHVCHMRFAKSPPPVSGFVRGMMNHPCDPSIVCMYVLLYG